MASLTDAVTDLVHEPTQTDSPGLDLTVAAVHEVVAPGRIDFGGGELEAATTSPRPTAKRNPDDDYEWWTLRAGQYLIEHNETLSGEHRVTIQPRAELLERGATHPTVTVTDLSLLPLSVSGGGLKLKENARVSTVVEAVPVGET